ncbi:hypothetical protein AYO38_04415 [bacterium SCGC AG-212-C10]|nr:hypothetical protein AYO38_04415 [bacterium SCGC AG-212-C10]
MTAYKIQLFLHVLAVVVGMGSTFALPFLQAFAERQGVAATRFAMQFSRRLENMVIVPGAILLFLFGLGLIFDDTTGYKDDMPGWLMIAVAWYIVVFIVAATVQRKNVTDAMRVLDSTPDGPTLPAEYVAVSKRIQMVGGLLGLSIVGIAFLMVYKPGQ